MASVPQLTDADGGGAGDPRARPWLTPTLLVVTLVSFMQDAASELLYPLLPIFLTGVLAAPPVVIGVVEGLADATAGIVRYYAGRWSDRFGRKPFIGAGYSLAAVGKGLVAGATGWPIVLAGRVSDRFGKGMRSAPRDALIAATTPREHLGRAFGFHRTGDSLGAVVGPLLGLAALSAMNDDVRAAMWWAVVPAVISALLTILIRDPDRAAPAAAAGTAPPARSTVSEVPLPTTYRRVVVVLVVIALVNFSDALLLLRLVEMGLSTTEVIAAYVVFNSVYTLGAYPAGALADRWPRRTIYSVGLFFFAVGYLGLGLVDGGAIVFVLLGAYGLFPAFTDGVGKAWVSSLVEQGSLGRAQGVYQAFNSGAVLVAGLWAGIMWNAGPGGGVVPLIISGTLAALAAVMMGGGFLIKSR